MVWLALLASAWGADPCYGFAHPNRVESEHYWVEYQDGVINAGQADDLLAFAEHAHDVYISDLGWPLTSAPVSIAVIEGEGEGTSGITQTVDCDGVPQPRIELSVGTWPEDDGEALIAHEIGHAAQYGYMGEYLESVTSWLWWMEGTATWLESTATEDGEAWGLTSGGYLANPWVALHQGPTAFLVPERSDHMYGTAYIARYMEEEYGRDAVRDTWEWAGPQSGTVLYFPDAIEAVGIEFEPFWERMLASTTVADLGWGEHMGRRVSAIDVETLPAEGEPAQGFFPEGTGFTAVHFDAAAGGPEQALEISFDGDSEVEWIVVIVRTDGFRVGDGTVIDYVPLELDGGEGSGWLSGFDGTVHGWLLASPISADAGPYRLSWEADLIADPGPMAEVIAFHEVEDPKGCGCHAAPAASAWLIPLLALVTMRRVRARPAAERPAAR